MWDWILVVVRKVSSNWIKYNISPIGRSNMWFRQICYCNKIYQENWFCLFLYTDLEKIATISNNILYLRISFNEYTDGAPSTKRWLLQKNHNLHLIASMVSSYLLIEHALYIHWRKWHALHTYNLTKTCFFTK